jgi:hypothetical protein
MTDQVPSRDASILKITGSGCYLKLIRSSSAVVPRREATTGVMRFTHICDDGKHVLLQQQKMS